jgi:hypothetical protein
MQSADVLISLQLCVSNFEALFEALQSLLNNTPALRAQLAKVSQRRCFAVVHPLCHF